MKRKISFLLFFASVYCILAIGFPVYSQNDQTDSELKPVSGTAVAAGVSVPVSSLPPAQPEIGKTSRQIERRGVYEIKNKERIRVEAPDVLHDADSALAQILTEQMPFPILSFDGLNSNDNAAAYGFRAIPPDTNGDVGPNHYVQAVNILLRVFDKNGTALTPPFKLSSVFAPLNTNCSRRDDGDPIVLYDPLADRWLLSAFCTLSPPFRQMIAVSQTNDPTGSYFVYEFIMPNFKFNDYPKFGVWRDGYYMTTDQFLGSDYSGSGAFAFERDKMLAGDPSAKFIYFDLATPSLNRLGGMLPSDLDGLNPPPANAANVFVSFIATEYGEPADALKLFDFRPNFINSAASTFRERAESPLAVAAFDPTSPQDRNDIKQPEPGDFLDSQSDRLMYRVAYRNFGGNESLVFNQTVRVSPALPYRAGVRLYELRRSGANSPFVVNNQMTIANQGISSWMGSAAQDFQGNLAVGYSTASEDKKPAIAYSGRLAADPPNTVRGEQTLV
ncbi:MAG TPA: hypothetical protein VEX64_10935, partial [Pyrinomonadaceae bacterium]|nr:hypothetical protein [Pyrinomonadaceae bacterium]